MSCHSHCLPNHLHAGYSLNRAGTSCVANTCANAKPVHSTACNTALPLNETTDWSVVQQNLTVQPQPAPPTAQHLTLQTATNSLYLKSCVCQDFIMNKEFGRMDVSWKEILLLR